MYYEPTGEKMLFDRKNDPMELTNLIDDPAYAEVADDMFKALMAELAHWSSVTRGPRHGAQRRWAAFETPRPLHPRLQRRAWAWTSRRHISSTTLC